MARRVEGTIPASVSRPLWRGLLPPLLVEGLATIKHRVVRAEPEPAEPPPWSPYYYHRKVRFLTDSVHDPQLLERFRCRQPLPAGYGVALDERCVEYPWLVAQLQPSAELVLDAGSTLNHEYLLTLPVLKHRCSNRSASRS
jgi:hypothetical protein